MRDDLFRIEHLGELVRHGGPEETPGAAFRFAEQDNSSGAIEHVRRQSADTICAMPMLMPAALLPWARYTM